MNVKSIWQSIDPTGSIPPDFFRNETVVNIVDILSFIKEHRDDVGISMYSLSVSTIANGTGIPESSVYRYMQKLTSIDLASLESKRVMVFQKIEMKKSIGGVLPDSFFKDINGTGILPNNINTRFIFVESGEITIKMFDITKKGNDFLDKAMKLRLIG